MTHSYGWRPDKPDQRDRQFLATPVALPKKVSLRSKMPPVYNQGNLGSCTANAIAAALEYEAMHQGQPAISPSRLFVYYNERAMEGSIDSDSGAEIRDGIKSVAKLGAPSEKLWPYQIAKFATKPPQTAYAAALKDRALDYARVGQSTTALKTALALGFPVVFGFTVYESFESDAVAASGRVPMPGKNERVLGGHAVLLTGYDATSGAVLWEVRNSWGSGWGDKGYFFMPCAYPTSTSLASDFWNIRKVA